MNGDRANIIRVSFEGGDLLGGIVVVDTELEVIRAANNPVLARNESTGTNRDIGKLECFDDRLGDRGSAALLRDKLGVWTYLRLVRPNVDMAAVESGQNLR